MLLVEVVKYLDSKGLVSFDEDGVSGDCFISTLPQAPDDAVAIYPRAGRMADGKLGYDYPSIQVLVRGTENPMPAITRAQAIYDTLHGFHGKAFATGGTHIVNCLGVQSSPVYIGKDENGRHEYSINFAFEIRNAREE